MLLLVVLHQHGIGHSGTMALEDTELKATAARGTEVVTDVLDSGVSTCTEPESTAVKHVFSVQSN